MKKKIFDTCSLLVAGEGLFNDPDTEIYISSISLEELENIKTSAYKDQETKYKARCVLRLLDANPDKYEVVPFKDKYMRKLKGISTSNNDVKIIACGLAVGDVIFVSNDLCCKQLASLFFRQVESIQPPKKEYKGYKEVCLDETSINDFYSDYSKNAFGLLTNEYLIIKDKKGKEIIDKLCWTGETHRRIDYPTFSSRLFGNVKPMKGDIYQTLLADSLINNRITMISGPAGSGKDYMTLGFLANQLEYGKIDKIVMFCNPVATKGAAKLGYYSGSREEKLLDCQVGNILSSKFGSSMAVEQMLNNEQLVLLPLSDIRGYETSGMHAGVYITEAQNMDVNLMKLALSRIGEDSICVLNGDFTQQVDMAEYEGLNNGMRRVSEVFRGNEVYGEVELQTIHRGRIAKLADQL